MSKLAILLFPVAAAFGQLTSNSVTVTASRITNLQPDEVVFSVTVSAPPEAGRDEVIAAVAGAGIQLVNFTGIAYYGQSSVPGDPDGTGTTTTAGGGNDRLVQWGFTLPVALSKMKSTLGLLSAMQQSLGRAGRFTLAFSVQGMQVSVPLQQAQACSLADLLADARAQAQKLASGAGMSLGGIQAMSTVATTMSVSTFLGTGGISAIGPYALPLCSLTVKFGLGGF